MFTTFCLKEQEIGNKITPPITHFRLVTIIVHHRTCFVEYETNRIQNSSVCGVTVLKAGDLS
jgi:hypothetical protein